MRVVVVVGGNQNRVLLRSRSLSFAFPELDFAWLWRSWPSPDPHLTLTWLHLTFTWPGRRYPHSIDLDWEGPPPIRISKQVLSCPINRKVHAVSWPLAWPASVSSQDHYPGYQLNLYQQARGLILLSTQSHFTLIKMLGWRRALSLQIYGMGISATWTWTWARQKQVVDKGARDRAKCSKSFLSI